MRRLYRPGAPKPVKLCFPVYTGTLAEAALDLIGQKMMAAQVFYGDDAAAGGALVDEGDDGDLLNDIVRKALGKLDVGRAEGIFALGNSQMATESGRTTQRESRLSPTQALILAFLALLAVMVWVAVLVMFLRV